jgi:hypothetical protein
MRRAESDYSEACCWLSDSEKERISCATEAEERIAEGQWMVG